MIRSFLKASFWVLVGNVISKIFNFVALTVVARFLDPKGLGIYNAIFATTNSINQFSDLGSSIVLQKESAKSDNLLENKVSLFYTTLGLQLIFNLIFSICIILFPDYFYSLFFNGIGSINLAYYSIPLILLQCIAVVPLTFLVGLGEFKLYSIRIIASSVLLTFFLIILLILFRDDVDMAIIALILSSLVNAFISWFVIYIFIKDKRIVFRGKRIKSNLRLIKEYGFIYFIGNTLIGAIVTLVMVGLFNTYISIENYGFLRIASSLTAILGIIPAAIQPVAINFLSNVENDVESLKSIQIRFLSFFIIIVTFIILVFLDPIINLLFGKEYLIGRNIIVFLISVQIFTLIGGVLSNFLVTSGHTKFIGWVSIIGALSNLVLSLLLIPRYGINGFYIAHFIGYFWGFVALSYKESKLFMNGLSTEIKYSTFLFLASQILIIPIFYIRDFFFLIIYGFIVLTFFTAIFVFKILKQNEKEQFMKLIIYGTSA